MIVLDSLPLGYSCSAKIDLRKDLKFSVTVNAMAILIGLSMFIIMNQFIPAQSYYEPEIGKTGNSIRKLILIAALIIYLILHEITHGLSMKLFGAKKVHYGFTGLYAYASCDDYIIKKAYYVIGLAPLVIWGIAFLVCNIIVNETWLILLFYWLQIVNVAGAAGDIFITLKLTKYPQDTLIRDEGTTMCFYSKQILEG